MNTVLNFMDKIYGDGSTLPIIYIVGAILLFIFIILLIFSLRSPAKKKDVILDEPNIEKDINNQKEQIEEDKQDEIVKEEMKIEDNIKTESIKEEVKEENNISLILDKAEETKSEEEKEINVNENKEIELPSLSSEIPDVDEYVDNIVKKTYEKNEQFSSVYVNDNTNTNNIKLEKVLDKLNVDKDIKEDIVPMEEKAIQETKEESNDKLENEPNNKLSSLDVLKKSLDEKKDEVINKQDNLKSKLDNLKKINHSNEILNAEDLLNKLNSLKK